MFHADLGIEKNVSLNLILVFPCKSQGRKVFDKQTMNDILFAIYLTPFCWT